MNQVQVATVCGSLGEGSANQAALDVAVNHLRSLHHGDALIADLAETPMFRADQVDHPPSAVARLRDLIESADVTLIAAPEYAGGLAGGLKNALDWLVGSGSLYHQVVGILSAGTTGGQHARNQLVRTLSWHGALVVAELGVTAPRTKSDEQGRLTDPATIAAIQKWAGTVAQTRAATAADRLAAVTEIVAPRGIDPARFGNIS